MKRAVQHALLIISEAAKHIPEELKAKTQTCRGTRYMDLETCCDTSTAGLIRISCGPW